MTFLSSRRMGAAASPGELETIVAFYRELVTACMRRTPLWLYLVALVPPALILAAVYAQPLVDPSSLLRDPAAVYRELGVPAHTAMYYGFVSNLGVLIWSSASFICLFVGVVLLTSTHDRFAASFMLASGCLTLMLVFDDFFMLHEVVLPSVTGLNDKYIYIFYAVLFVAYCAVFHLALLRQHGMLLLVAVSFFALSTGLNVITKAAAFGALGELSGREFRYLLEDGTKLFGISAWVTFHIRAAWDVIGSTCLNSR